MRSLHSLINRDVEKKSGLEAARRLIDDIPVDTIAENMTHWELEFIESIYDRTVNGYPITETQLEWLQKIHDKHA